MSLNNVKGETCIIVGTLYKHQELKPSVLQEVSKQVSSQIDGKSDALKFAK